MFHNGLNMDSLPVGYSAGAGLPWPDIGSATTELSHPRGQIPQSRQQAARCRCNRLLHPKVLARKDILPVEQQASFERQKPNQGKFARSELPHRTAGEI